MMQQNTFKQTEIGIIPEGGARDRLVEKDTINSLSDNERTVFGEMQAQIKQNLAGFGYGV